MAIGRHRRPAGHDVRIGHNRHVSGGVPKVTVTSSPTSGRLSVVSVARYRTFSTGR